MIGRLKMTKFLQDKLGLTKLGAQGMLRAAMWQFISLVISMAPMISVMLFAQYLFNHEVANIVQFSLLVGVIVLALWLVERVMYDATYTATYKECEALRIEVCDCVKNLPMSYYSKHDYTDISQIITEDIALLEQAFSHALPQLIGLVPFLVLISIMLIASNVKLGLAIVAPILLCLIFPVMSKKLQKSIASEYYGVLRDNSAAFQQAIDMQREIKSYNLTQSVKEDLDKQLEYSEKVHFKGEMTMGLFLAIPWALLDLVLGLVIIVGAKLYISGDINALYLIGYILAGANIANATKVVFEYVAMMFTIDSRIAKFKDMKSACDVDGAVGVVDGGDVEFRDVTFGYTPDRTIINNLSFVANRGETTALVSPSGCGKTTVLRLLASLYDADQGQVLIDGYDIKDIKSDNLFDNISIVFQDVTLFNSSVYDNIAIGNTDASKEEVLHAARLANCNDFVDGLSDGFDTLIGENGCSLSGGERQRISIARAFLKDAPIIILDEIAANLDIENENKIQESLQRLIKDKTVIIISHRMKSVENVDKIIVLDDGVCVDSGTHSQLMHESDLYKQMVDKSRLTEEFVY